MPLAAELLPELLVVVDLAVEDEVQRSEMQRLVRPLVEVDDHQPPYGKARVLVVPDALAVGTAPPHRFRHPLEQRSLRRPARGSGDSAHVARIAAAPGTIRSDGGQTEDPARAG